MLCEPSLAGLLGLSLPSSHFADEVFQIAGFELRHGEQIKALGGVHLPGVAVFDERAGRGVEGHADVHWGITRPPEMLHFMAAVAHADADVRGRLDDV